MSKVYFITRSYEGISMHGQGGVRVRTECVSQLRLAGLDTWVVMPDMHSGEVNVNAEQRIIKIPGGYNRNISLALEKIGFLEDHLNNWINNTIEYLTSVVTPRDILIGAVGGSLATLKIADVIKERCSATTIINFHDPLLYTTYEGKMIRPNSKFPHVNRDHLLRKYLASADTVVTSSKAYADHLKSVVQSNQNIDYAYFGYMNPLKPKDDFENNEILKIIYGGNMSKTQSPEILANSLGNDGDVNLYFIGDSSDNQELLAHRNTVNLLPKMSKDDYELFLKNNADVGFLSLKGILSHLCVPSKLYDYINLCIPILAVIENEDVRRIVEDNHFGVVCSFNEKEIAKSVEKLKSYDFRRRCYESLKLERDKWSMMAQFEKFIEIVKNSKS